MSTIIETDLKDLLIQINGKLDKLTDDVNGLKASVANDINELKVIVANDINDLKVSVANDINDLKVSVSNDINELKVTVGKLDEGQKGISKRLENVEFFNRSIFAGIVVGIILGAIKMFFLKP